MSEGLSIIIPVLNEADILESNTLSLVQYLGGLDMPYEVIVVDNGSTDGTTELGEEIQGRFDRVRFYSLPRPGVGSAFSLGVREAAYEAIVSLDMDLSIDMGFIPRAYKLLSTYEVVVGSKKMGAQVRSFWRKAGSTAFILTARFLLGLSFEDYSIAAKAYRRDVALGYLDRIDHGTSYVLDIIYHMTADGGRAVEIPVFCEDFRPSKFNLLHEAMYRFRNLFRLWLNYGLSAKRRGVKGAR